LIKKKARIASKMRNNNPNVNPTPSPTINFRNEKEIKKLKIEIK